MLSTDGRHRDVRLATVGSGSLQVAQTGPAGWNATKVPDATSRLYRHEIRRLHEAIVAYRNAEVGSGRGGRASSNNGLALRARAPDPGIRRSRIRRADHVRQLWHRFRRGMISCDFGR